MERLRSVQGETRLKVVRASSQFCDHMGMANQTPLEAVIAEVAQSPQSASTDNTSVTERSATDLIAMDQHLAGNQALRKPGLGIIRQKIRRGSALG